MEVATLNSDSAVDDHFFSRCREKAQYVFPTDGSSTLPLGEEHKQRILTKTRILKLDGLETYMGSEKSFTLDIEFAFHGPFSRQPLKLFAMDTSFFSDRPWRARNATLIPGSRIVYRASLEVHGGQTIEVALKLKDGFDERDELVDETQLYKTKLSQVQGVIVPKYLGVFTVIQPRPNKSLPRVLTCLVLTYVGEALPNFIDKLPCKERSVSSKPA